MYDSNLNLKESVHNIRAYASQIVTAAATHAKVHENLHVTDFFVNAVLNRSLSLVHGFCTLIETNNFLAAGPLVRLQIDNAIRFNALNLVDNPGEFVSEVWGGKPIRKMKDRTGAFMTDKYLSDELNKKYEWVAKTYAEANALIHLSETHIMTMMNPEPEGPDGSRIVNMVIGFPCAFIADEILESACVAFQHATDCVLDLVVEVTNEKLRSPGAISKKDLENWVSETYPGK